MSAAQLRSAARAGDAPEVARLLDGQFRGTQTSRRLERLAVCIRRLVREHAQRHAAEPEAVPKFMTLEVLQEEYRRANNGTVLRPLDYGFREMEPLLEAMPTACSLTYPRWGEKVTAIKPAEQMNSAAYNIAGGIPEAKIRLPVDASDSEGRSSLWWAAKEGRAEVVQLLLNRKAAPDACASSTGNTALLMAAVGGHMDVVQLLLKCGAKPNAVNRKGNTAIMVARSKEIVQALILAGADATTINYVRKAGIVGRAVREPQKPGGPPRGYADAQYNRMNASGRRVGDAGLGACELFSPFMCGPPGVERGVHFGSDRSQIAVWGSDSLPKHEYTAADVQWSLGNKEAARFLQHHQTPQHSEKQATSLLAARDVIGAAEAATVGLAVINCAKRSLHEGSKTITKEVADAKYNHLEATQQKLNGLLQRCRSPKLRDALRRMKVTDLLKLTATTATTLLEDPRWMPMRNRGTTEQVETRHIESALRNAEDIPDMRERRAAQKAAIVEVLLERHHAMLAARMAAAGQHDVRVEKDQNHSDGMSPTMMDHTLGAPRTGAQSAGVRSTIQSDLVDRDTTMGVQIRGKPAWN